MGAGDGINPAQYSDTIIDWLRDNLGHIVDEDVLVFDPFAGEGTKLGRLCDELGLDFAGNDLERWKDRERRVRTADSTIARNYPSRPFVVVTSPCLAHGQRVLRDDLRWILVENIKVGDQLVAFDEFPTSRTPGGRMMRRWQLTEVTHSESQPAECVNVHLTNGEVVTCTLNHPWLAEKFPDSTSTGSKWIEARDLEGQVVYRQLNTWRDSDSYDAGWLAGMYDGEGTFNVGERTSLKLSIIQKPGAVLDEIKNLLNGMGYEWTAYERSSDDCEIIYINGGVSRVMEVLGELRPIRLLEKWTSMPPWGFMAVQGAERVRVEKVVPVGVKDIQGITTTTGTYIGEGYLHHNTYNNGVNDHFKPADTSRRLTYRNSLGHELHPHNTGRYSGRGSKTAEAEYWRLHRACVIHWPDLVVVNVKDSQRAGKTYPLGAKWMALLRKHNYTITSHKVPVTGWRFGENHEARSDFEWVLVGKKESQ